MAKYKFHNASKIVPQMSEKEFNELHSDIKEHGFRETVKYCVLDGERVYLDGRHRLKVADLMKLDPENIKTTTGKPLLQEVKFKAGESIVAYISSLQKRRNLTAGQKAALAVDLEPEFAKEAKENQRIHGKTAPGKKKEVEDDGTPSAGKKRAPTAAKKAAQATGASERNAQTMKQLKKESPELYNKVIEGDLTVNAAAKQLKAEKSGKAISSAAEKVADIKPEDFFEFVEADLVEDPKPLGKISGQASLVYGNFSSAVEGATIVEAATYGKKLIAQANKASKDHGSLFLIADPEVAHGIAVAASESGYRHRATIALEKKVVTERTDNYKDSLLVGLYFVKTPPGKSGFTFNSVVPMSDIQKIGQVPAGETVTGIRNQIPVHFLSNIIETLTVPGDVVVDMFTAAGEMASACIALKRYCTSFIESSEKNRELIEKRLLVEINRISKKK